MKENKYFLIQKQKLNNGTLLIKFQESCHTHIYIIYIFFFFYKKCLIIFESSSLSIFGIVGYLFLEIMK